MELCNYSFPLALCAIWGVINDGADDAINGAINGAMHGALYDVHHARLCNGSVARHRIHELFQRPGVCALACVVDGVEAALAARANDR